MGKGKQRIRLEIMDEVQEERHIDPNVLLLYVLNGQILVEEKEKIVLDRQDLYVVNSCRQHRIAAEKGALWVRVSVEFSLITEVLQCDRALFLCSSVSDSSPHYDELRDHLREMVLLYLQNGETENFACLSAAYSVLDTLCEHFMVRRTDTAAAGNTQVLEDRIQKIDSYIRTRYMEPISIHDLAAQLHLSEGYLYRFFKKYFSASFEQYLSSIRLYHASEDLLETGDTVTRIAMENGFSSVDAFNRAFRNTYRQTPGEFRRSKAGRAEEPESKDENGKKRTADLAAVLLDERKMRQASGEQQEAACSADRLTGMMKAVDTVNGGTAGDLLKNDVMRAVKLLHQKIGFRYLRVEGLFSDETMLRIQEDPSRNNYAMIDQVIDFIQEIDCIPHLDIGIKQKALIADATEEFIYEKDQTVVPEDAFRFTDAYIRTVKSLLEHMINRYGLEYVDTWRLELWFPEQWWGNEKREEGYARLFSGMKRMIRRFSRGIRFGGPGFRTDFALNSPETAERFLTCWKAAGEQPDFISFTYFNYLLSGDGGVSGVRKNADEHACFHVVSRLRQLLDENGFSGIPLRATVWGMTYSDRCAINDSPILASFMVREILETMEIMGMPAYFWASDCVAQYYDTGSFLFGGRGLAARETILKPSAYALSFFHELYSGILFRSGRMIISSLGRDRFTILAQNFRTFSELYYQTKDSDLRAEDLWKYQRDRKSISLTAIIDHVEDGIYQVKHYQVSHEYGSIQDIWREASFEQNPSRNDLDYFRQGSSPKLTISRIRAEDGCLRIPMRLQANEIQFVRARKTEE